MQAINEAFSTTPRSAKLEIDNIAVAQAEPPKMADSSTASTGSSNPTLEIDAAQRAAESQVAQLQAMFENDRSPWLALAELAKGVGQLYLLTGFGTALLWLLLSVPLSSLASWVLLSGYVRAVKRSMLDRTAAVTPIAPSASLPGPAGTAPELRLEIVRFGDIT